MQRTEILEMLTSEVPDFSGKNLYIWGTGNTAALYQEGLKRISLGNIRGYCDNHPKTPSFQGLKIFSPQELCYDKNAYVLLCTPQPELIREIGAQLDGLNLQWCLIEEAVLKRYSSEVIKSYDLLEDEESKRTYAKLIECRLKGTYPDSEVYEGEQYFHMQRFTRRSLGRAFVDCGAFVGDSLEKYIWNQGGVFDKIIAFEPDPENFKALEHRRKRLLQEWNLAEDSIQIVSAGVGCKNEEIHFERADSGLGSKFISEGSDIGITGRVVALDDYLKQPYSFLKADIESYEYNMLLGASEGIKKWKPDLALSIYHNAVDFFSLIQLIHSMVPEYKFIVRHHLYTLAETVLYAWVE